jgi:D-arginine dehydrogenase
VVVVGGGMAGVSVAFELADAGAEVVLLEAEAQLAHHTTGRSAAMYLPAYGNPVVRALTRASLVDFSRLAERFELPPLLSPRAELWIADEGSQAHLDAELAGNVVLERLTVDEAAERCPALRPEVLTDAAVDPAGHEIDVLALHGGYVRGLRAAGGQVVRTARVHAVERPPGGGWCVHAGDVQVTAPTVVDAAGAWADEVAALAGVPTVGLQPLRRTLFTSPVTWPDPIDGWPIVIDAAERLYFKPEAGQQLLVSPADETPMPPCDVQHEVEDVALALEMVNARTTLGLRSVRAAWAGLRTFAPDRTPVAGSTPEHPGFVWLAGQGGYGIQLAPALARTTAALALGRALPADVAAEGGTAEWLAPGRLMG